MRKSTSSRPSSVRKSKSKAKAAPQPVSASLDATPDTSLALRDSAPVIAESRSPHPYPHPVVGIGGSAGALEALHDMLSTLPPDLDAPLIFVQHLSSHSPSILPELLKNVSKFRIQQAADGMPVKPRILYIAPADSQLTLLGGTLQLTPLGPAVTNNYSIDAFFSSLAADAGPAAVGIALSGLSGDGAAGLREIQGVSGITIAQDPKTARYDILPRAAIQAGAADFILAPADIAKEVAAIGQNPLIKAPIEVAAPVSNAGAAPSEEAMARLFSMLRSASGVDFTHYKQPTIRRRLQRRMVLHKVSTVEQYLKYVQQNPNEIKSLYQDILIHVTRFFRDPESFQVLAERVFPRLHEGRSADEPIRIWIPGCSTGEEPYSVAVSLLEYLGDEANAFPIQIFATDVSDAAVEHARAGVYSDAIAADVSPERLRRFFTRVDGHYRIAKSVRDCCIFARQDLTRDPPFSKLDLIICRNVLIYLGPVLQKRLMNVFHYALKPNGFLILGGAETVGPHVDLFTIVDKRHKIYAKKINVAHPVVDFPPVEYAARTDVARRTLAEVRASSTIQQEANRIILAKYSPPGVIVDNELKIVQFRGQTGAFLEPAPGEASLNLLKMAREGLLYGLRTAIHEARKNDTEVRKEGLRIKVEGSIVNLTLSVTPIGTHSPEGRHFLVLFEHARSDQRLVTKGKRAAKALPAPRDDERVARLQQELAASREYLQSIIQDLEAANEELQSANEEILSSNEELQSTNEELDTAKEELQSTNEELNTVNEELQGRNEELMRANSDLVNLLASVQIAIVMVAADLRIRRFTPMAERVLNLIPTDIGRPISDIKPNIDCPDLEQLIIESVDTVTIKEREVRDRHGNWFSLRIRPYKNVENRIDGAVLALFDIDHPTDDSEGTPQPRAKGEKQ